MGARSKIGEINAKKNLVEAMRQSPFEVMGKGNVSFDEWKSLPSDVKEYSYYAYTEKLRGDEPLPFNEWDKQTTDPVKKQYFDLAKEDPEFEKWLTKYNESSATQINIEGAKDKASALADVKADKYITNPRGLSEDVAKNLDSDAVQDQLIKFYGEPETLKTETEKINRKFIENKIKNVQGKIVQSGYDGDDMVWVIETKTGETVVYRYPR